VLEADLIVHVRDISHADSEAQAQDVLQVLAEIGLSPEARVTPMLTVFNKIDALDDEARAIVMDRAGEDAIPASALTGDGLERLQAAMDTALRAGSRVLDVTLDASDGRRLAWLHQHGEVVARSDADDGSLRLQVRLSDKDQARFAAL
jgi:GTP-binding protein HflX